MWCPNGWKQPESARNSGSYNIKFIYLAAKVNKMKSAIIFILFLTVAIRGSFAQNIPEGYLLQYQQNFSSAKSLADFRVDDPSRWGIFKNNNNYYLQCSSPLAPNALPSNIAVVINKIMGDFILEADVMPVTDSAGNQEACIFVGIRDSKYYFIQFSNVADSNRHGIFLVRNSGISRITDDSLNPVAWNGSTWHKVRLERNIIRRTIRVFFDNMEIPLMQVKDYELVMGSVGFGTLAGTARFDNVKIWAPTVLTEDELKSME